MNSNESKVNEIKELLHLKDPIVYIIAYRDWYTGDIIGYLHKNAEANEFYTTSRISDAKSFNKESDAKLLDSKLVYPLSLLSSVEEIKLPK